MIKITSIKINSTTGEKIPAANNAGNEKFKKDIDQIDAYITQYQKYGNADALDDAFKMLQTKKAHIFKHFRVRFEPKELAICFGDCDVRAVEEVFGECFNTAIKEWEEGKGRRFYWFYYRAVGHAVSNILRGARAKYKKRINILYLESETKNEDGTSMSYKESAIGKALWEKKEREERDTYIENNEDKIKSDFVNQCLKKDKHKEVFKFVCNGATNETIAELLNCNERTVLRNKKFVKEEFRKYLNSI